MIDQQLGINILNNLLCIQVPSDNLGDEAQRDAVLNSSFLTDKSDESLLCFNFTNCQLENENAYEGGYLESGVGTTFASPKIFNVNTLEEAQQKVQQIEEAYTAPQLKATYIKEQVFLEIGAVDPPISKTTGEKEKIYAIGMLEDELKSLKNAVLNLNPVIVTGGQESNQELETQISQLNSNVQQIASTFKKKVLVNYPYYSNSFLQGGFYYEKDNDGSEKSTKIEETTLVPITTYTYTTEIHFFVVKYPDSKTGETKQIATLPTRKYYKKQVKNITCNLSSWYYSQAFSTSAYYPEKAYIGLFTDYNHSNDLDKNSTGMPDADGTKFREPPHKSENTPEGTENYTYQRMNLHRGLFSDGYVFNEVKKAVEEDVSDKENPSELLGKALLRNHEIIMFPEILHNGSGETKGWGNIYGFGVFDHEFSTEGEKPYFWGPVVNAPIVTDKDEVPLFRPAQFEVFLG